MATEHERWIIDLLAAVPVEERENLHRLLGALKVGLAQTLETHRELAQ